MEFKFTRGPKISSHSYLSFFQVQESDKGSVSLLTGLREEMATFKDSHLGK